ncbi:MAG: hypothetical protein R3D55_19100 [Chloroflexota bacterium]
MATLSVKSIAANCLDRTPTFSLRRHIFGVYGNNNRNRSLKAQLNLIRNRPHIRVAIVTVRPVGSTQGQYANLQRDLDLVNDVWQDDAAAWVYCTGVATIYTNILGTNGVLNQNSCPLGVQGSPTQEEDDLFDLGRNLGADVVGYYITGSTNPGLIGCSAYPAGRRGFWVAMNSNQNTFGHELTHVIGLNPHPNQDPLVPDDDQDNLMWPAPGAITNPPPDLRQANRNRILGDPGMESC